MGVSQVFSEDLPRLPRKREIVFEIMLQPDSTPISTPPYHMLIVEMNEFKKQLDKLLAKGFVQSSI